MNFEQFLSFLRICMYILYIIKTIDYKKLQNSGYIAILYPALVNFGPAATHCYMRFRTLIHYFIFMDLELCSVDVFVLLLFSFYCNALFGSKEEKQGEINKFSIIHLDCQTKLLN